ncbi:hypothetical protein ACFOYW_08265 [Gryllotalpicola reticulitermitis]|uniref:HNH endonuclease n=1 Tax=Gryllotalpicola reticulitermitis TaxID=1184153 RepID=A0ABV8Q7D4_9MICO
MTAAIFIPGAARQPGADIPRCQRGHALVGDNCYWWPSSKDGKPRCKTCHRAAKARYKRRRALGL